jgi:hypothetical protein
MSSILLSVLDEIHRCLMMRKSHFSADISIIGPFLQSRAKIWAEFVDYSGCNGDADYCAASPVINEFQR